MTRFSLLSAALLFATLTAMAANPPKNPLDSHSFSNPQVVRQKHVALDLEADFATKTLKGTATLEVEGRTPSDLILDTRDLSITRVETAVEEGAFRPGTYQLGDEEPYLGRPLTVALPAGTRFVRVHYSTAPTAQGLQWLTPEQTAGKRHPFLFTQSEPTYARTWVPLQDSPGARITYSATIRCPKELRAVMSAQQDWKAPLDGEFRFQLNQPIAPYLLALAIGDLKFQSTGPRTGVVADPAVLASAAREFADTEQMIVATEKLYGPYRWGRYDLLILPPSFPFGGMENPLLTFATPTVIAGDKSLVSLVAHELAHSWSGNLVTNASWRDFWLNEGFTTYVENRIQEAIYGKERADMEFVLEVAELKQQLADLKPEDQILHITLDGRDPEDGQTLVPYVKGALLLKLIEGKVGRSKFDAWLRAYFDKFSFRSITTAEFRNDVLSAFPELKKDGVEWLDEWLEKPGLPASAPVITSSALQKVDEAAKLYSEGELDLRKVAWDKWSTQERVRFLEQIRPTITQIRVNELDQVLKLNDVRNAEVRLRWLLLAIDTKYRKADSNLEDYLELIGRRKLVLPLYRALARTSDGKAQAKSIYEGARAGYHPITQASVDALLQ